MCGVDVNGGDKNEIAPVAVAAQRASCLVPGAWYLVLGAWRRCGVRVAMMDESLHGLASAKGNKIWARQSTREVCG